MEFALEPLLRHCEAMAHHEELALAALSRELARVCGQADAWRALGKERRNLARQQLERGLSAVELHVTEDCVQIATAKISVLEHEIARLKESWERQWQKLMASRRRVEELLTLRKHQQERLEREQLQRQQQELDEMFLMRRIRNRY